MTIPIVSTNMIAPRTTYSIKLDASTQQHLEAAARRKGVSRHAFLQKIIGSALADE